MEDGATIFEVGGVNVFTPTGILLNVHVIFNVTIPPLLDALLIGLVQLTDIAA